jgi:hypothetical protein
VTLNEAQVAPARPAVDLAIALARCVGLRRAAVVEAPSGDRALLTQAMRLGMARIGASDPEETCAVLIALPQGSRAVFRTPPNSGRRRPPARSPAAKPSIQPPTRAAYQPCDTLREQAEEHNQNHAVDQ